MLKKVFLICFLAGYLLSTGCTIVHTTPLAARNGDTVVVAVGSPDGMNVVNTDLSYTPDGGSPIAIPDSFIRAIFDLYPSKLSAAWLYSNSDLIENESGNGPSTTVIVFDLPGGPGDTSGIVLPAGPGNLQVSTTANYEGIIPSVNNRDIALEILQGTGTPSSYDYLGLGGIQLGGDLTQLENMKRLEFRPTWTGYDDTNTYGAVEVKIGIDSSGINEDDFNIIVDDKVGTLQTRRVHSTWNKTRFELTVYFISPTGKLQYSDVNFAVVSTDLQNQFETGAQSVSGNVTINSVTWYDVNGAIDTSGPAINIVNLTGT